MEACNMRSCPRCGKNFRRDGEKYLCPDCRTGKQPEISAGIELTFREKQIVTLVAQAKPNKEIAYELCLVEATVKEYVHHIFRKLGVKNRTELALLWKGNLNRIIAAPIPPELAQDAPVSATIN